MQYEYELKETILDVSDVSYAYESHPVLKGLSFTVRNIVRPHHTKPQGQVVSLLGKSGVGKSTLLKILAGQLAPQTGTVLMKVHPTDEQMQPPKEGNVGIVYQDYIFFEHLTVQKLLEMGARQGGLSDGEAKPQIQQLLEEFGLKGHENKWRQELSGGQRQRVAIAQQLLLGRQILILDEPFSGLDYEAKTRVASFIQKVAQVNEMKTLIVITHDIESAVSISDSIFLLAPNIDGKGASIRATFNLMSEGIAWRPDNHLLPAFQKVVLDIKQLFLAGSGH